MLIIMKTVTLLLAFLVATCGCSPKKTPTLAEDLKFKDSAASASVEAGKFLQGLHEQDKLPGVSKNEHGQLKAKVSNFAETVHYPLSFTFEFRKPDGSICCYTVEKAGADSTWNLTRAWQTDNANKMLKQFPTQ